jgi:hypothetical protein
VLLIIDSPSIKDNTQWMGQCTMQSDGSVFPIILAVESRKGADFSGNVLPIYVNLEGTVQWPTLNSAKTKFKGKISGNTQSGSYE